MSKVTFRADEDLIRRVEDLDASKSEVMRDALRAYLEGEHRAADAMGATVSNAAGLDVTISIEPSAADSANEESGQQETRRTPEPTPQAPNPSGGQNDRSCGQCGEELSHDHIYCPNCGEKASNRLFCDCGDEIRSDWAHCPSCGRRTPSADVLNR